MWPGLGRLTPWTTFSSSARHRSRRVRQQLDIDQRRLDRAVSQSSGQHVQRDAVGQQVAGVAVSQRVAGDAALGVEHAGVDGPLDCFGDPLGHPLAAEPDQPGVLRHAGAQTAVVQADLELRAELGMDRDDARLAALAAPDPQGGAVGLELRRLPEASASSSGSQTLS